jgi:hypothetical protein
LQPFAARDLTATVTDFVLAGGLISYETTMILIAKPEITLAES